MLQRIEYQRLFYRQHLEMLSYFHLMKVYKYCLISNFYQTIASFAIDFLYFLEQIMITKIRKIYRKNFPLTAII